METIPRASFRVVIAAPLAPAAGHRRGAPPPTAALVVDAEGLDAAVARCAGTLCLRVANRLSGHPAALDVALPITSMATFRPEVVAAQVPLLAPWLALRRLLGEVAVGSLTVEQLGARVRDEVADGALVAEVERLFGHATARPVGAPTPPAAGAVDAILDMVDLPAGVRTGEGGSPPSAAASAVAHLAAAWGRQRGHVADPRAVAAACAAVDRQISAQLDEIFATPHFRELEAAWRGIALLVRRVGRLEGVRLEVVVAPLGEEVAALREAVVEPWYAGAAETPPSLLVVARPLSTSPPSLATLGELAELGEEVQAPVVVEVGERFFGPDGPAAIPSLAIHLQGDAYAGWRSLRDKEASRWLAAVHNRFCLRVAHGDDPSRRRPFTYREAAGPLWGSPPLLVALLACAAFGATGWPGPVAGEVGELDLAGDRATAAILGPEAVVTLADHGIVAVAPVPGRDRVRLGPAVTVHRPRQLPAEAERRLERARADLAYPLVVGQFVALLHHLTPGLAGRSDGEAAAVAEAAFRGRLGEGGAVVAEVGPHPERTDRRLLQLRLTPPAAVLASRAVVEMGVAIPV